MGGLQRGNEGKSAASQERQRRMPRLASQPAPPERPQASQHARNQSQSACPSIGQRDTGRPFVVIIIITSSTALNLATTFFPSL